STGPIAAAKTKVLRTDRSTVRAVTLRMKASSESRAQRENHSTHRQCGNEGLTNPLRCANCRRGESLSRGGFASIFARQQEAEELRALAATALEHVSTGKHFARHFPELARTEIETPVELRDGLEDLLMGKVRITQRAHLHSGMPDQPATILAQPAILCG